MRKLLIILLAALSIVSCKNIKKNRGLTKVEVQEQKTELSDSLISIIDSFAIQFINESDKGIRIPELFELTDAEKMVKPTYLLDPSVANTLVTRSQKINALAYYMLEYGVREAYDMPLDQAAEAIAKLSADTDFFMDLEYLKSDASESEKISRIYDSCKEKGDLESFWQFQCAFVFHTDYIIACNHELFIPKLSEEGLKQFNLRLEFVNDAATALAPYDEEMAALLKEIKEWDLLLDDSEWDAAFATESTTAQFYISNKNAIIERRNRMLE